MVLLRVPLHHLKNMRNEGFVQFRPKWNDRYGRIESDDTPKWVRIFPLLSPLNEIYIFFFLRHCIWKPANDWFQIYAVVDLSPLCNFLISMAHNHTLLFCRYYWINVLVSQWTVVKFKFPSVYMYWFMFYKNITNSIILEIVLYNYSVYSDIWYSTFSFNIIQYNILCYCFAVFVN
jgi:hypothetical protein